MAVDKLVDSAVLDADLTSVADAIREKGGTSESLAFPAGFVSAIGDISGGGGKIASGSIYVQSEGTSLDIPLEGANTYKYFALWLEDMYIKKPGYKVFFCVIADMKKLRKWFGYTNNAGNADVGNLYASEISDSGSMVIADGNKFRLYNMSGATTESTFGRFLGYCRYSWAAWGDINE